MTDDHVCLIRYADMRTLMRMSSEATADMLTEAAALHREQGHTFTSAEVADLLTGYAAIVMRSAARNFGGTS